jgi:hypothetical protein
MRRSSLVGLVDCASVVEATCDDRAAIVAAIDALSRLAAWCESQRLVCVQALESLGVASEPAFAEASRCSLRDADKVVQRAPHGSESPGVW